MGGGGGWMVKAIPRVEMAKGMKENARCVKRVMAVADNKSILKFALACSFGTKIRYKCCKWG